MKLYTLLSGIGFLKKYNAKFMFIAFLGIHIPLLGLIIFLILSSASTVDKVTFVLMATGLTLLASVVTLFVLNALTAPLKTTQQVLAAYLENQPVTGLPETFDDEIGLIMRDINTLIAARHITANQKEEMIKALSRDLRAPATHILSLTALIQNANTPAEQAEHIKGLELSVKRQLQLMDKLIHNYQAK